MTIKRFTIGTSILLVVLLINLPFLATAVIEGKAEGKIFRSADAPVKPVALVLGAAAYNPNSLSAVLEDRMKAGVDLYKKGKVKKLILSGATNEVIAMANYAVKAGMPQLDILGDQNGYNTFASISDIADDYQDIIVVTQEYHLPRALFYAEHLGINAVGVVADFREYDKISDFKKRERIAHTKALFDVYIFSWLLSDDQRMRINSELSELG